MVFDLTRGPGFVNGHGQTGVAEFPGVSRRVGFTLRVKRVLTRSVRTTMCRPGNLATPAQTLPGKILPPALDSIRICSVRFGDHKPPLRSEKDA